MGISVRDPDADVRIPLVAAPKPRSNQAVPRFSNSRGVAGSEWRLIKDEL
jgi:hypothetical protein